MDERNWLFASRGPGEVRIIDCDGLIRIENGWRKEDGYGQPDLVGDGHASSNR
jgi:hypothetical protein